jgi:beta-N-acetylhexosaminidase
MGIIGSAKHFPGLGEAALDTHHELPQVEKSWKKLWQEDLYPYRALRGELDMVLVGHANYSEVTPRGLPASLSKKWITGILRNRVGYRGLVVSDDLEMGGVLKAAPIEQAAVEHIRAGGDLCLICRVEENVARAYEALIREALRDPRFARRVAASSKRVLAFKHRSPQLRRKVPPPTPAKVAEAIRAIAEFNESVRGAQIGRPAGASREQP